jgi:CO dehydrogenase/acetyl-CoA synthase epsilon subunit
MTQKTTMMRTKMQTRRLPLLMTTMMRRLQRRLTKMGQNQTQDDVREEFLKLRCETEKIQPDTSSAEPSTRF